MVIDARFRRVDDLDPAELAASRAERPDRAVAASHTSDHGWPDGADLPPYERSRHRGDREWRREDHGRSCRSVATDVERGSSLRVTIAEVLPEPLPLVLDEAPD